MSLASYQKLISKSKKYPIQFKNDSQETSKCCIDNGFPTEQESYYVEVCCKSMPHFQPQSAMEEKKVITTLKHIQ